MPTNKTENTFVIWMCSRGKILPKALNATKLKCCMVCGEKLPVLLECLQTARVFIMATYSPKQIDNATDLNRPFLKQAKVVDSAALWTTLRSVAAG